MPDEREPRGGHARYGHTGAGGGRQDQAERKDEGWRSRQGGDESRAPGRKSETEESARPASPTPPQGTNTQGELPGINEASQESLERLRAREERGQPDDERSDEERAAAGTDQPPRMGGPLGPEPKHNPRLPRGAQSSETRGSGAGGFDRGVNAKMIGEVHQGAREEDARDGPSPEDPGAATGAPPEGGRQAR